MRSLRPPNWLIAGAAARLAVAPFLLQWFHPDERQMLEFAHFHAHGRLKPFLESELHLRNQTLPWLLSWLIRAADFLGLGGPRAYLLLIHLVIGLFSLWACRALVRSFDLRFPDRPQVSSALGWFYALFWPFPFLFSRPLLESVSFIPAAWLWLELERGRYARAGFWSGVAAFTRYPSALFAPGAALVTSLRIARDRCSRATWLHAAGWSALGIGFAIAIGGLADRATWNRWLESAPSYWAFNRPGGPVASMFGHDSLVVYYRFFEYCFSPWLAPVAVALSAYALAQRRELLLFLAPYLIGHLWTPHREPRFMLPLIPFLALAAAETWAAGGFDSLVRSTWGRMSRSGRRVLIGLVIAQLVLHFAWYPLMAWGQLRSSLGQVIRHSAEIGAQPTDLLTLADPLIDAIVPDDARWAERDCVWQGGSVRDASHRRFWVLAESAPTACVPAITDPVPALPSAAWARVLRVHPGQLWACPGSLKMELCPDQRTIGSNFER